MAARELSGPTGGKPGRPAGSTTERTARLPDVRCTPQQREAFDAAGGPNWIRAQLDKLLRKRAA
jgi:hypothetical protein